MRLTDQELAFARSARGFMPVDEGDALVAAAADADISLGPFLEVGSYCGKSASYLGAVAKARSTVLFCVDHHRGSEENQVGWQWHEPDLVDSHTGLMDTLPVFRRTIADSGLEPYVVAVVGQSQTVAVHWATPLSLVFIDGGHGVEPARTDYESWVPHVAVGGLLAIHDVFADPGEGGQAPHDQIFSPAMNSGQFELVSATGSLRVLVRTSSHQAA